MKKALITLAMAVLTVTAAMGQESGKSAAGRDRTDGRGDIVRRPDITCGRHQLRLPVHAGMGTPCRDRRLAG